MNKELLLDMFYAAPELWYIVFTIVVSLIFISVFFYINTLKLRQKNYFITRKKDRYAETINASKDGYFIFVYPDDRINNSAQITVKHCSRRLAVILSLPSGIDSSFEDIIKSFYKDDAEKIRKYVTLLREDGVLFEDKFILKNGKTLNVNGARVSGADGSVYGDIIWFRDISGDADYINSILDEQKFLKNKLKNLEDIVDNLPYPVWLRNPSLGLSQVNKKYMEFVNCPDKNNIIINGIEIEEDNNENTLKTLAQKSQKSNQAQTQNIIINIAGKRCCFEAVETPFHSEESLDKISTVGTLRDITELDEFKHHFEQHQNAHLEILGALGTAFAVFDSKYRLSFYNNAFKELWRLDNDWLEKRQTYSSFLDNLREHRLLPEVPDYPFFKSEEQKMFNKIIEPKEDLLHLPDERTLRRLRAPYLQGGLVFAYEDISDRLAASREYSSFMGAQQEILDNMEEAVLIFEENGRLKLYNKSYVNLWNADEAMLSGEPTFSELLDMQKDFFDTGINWAELKRNIRNHLFSNNTRAISLRRNDGCEIECSSSLLSNESIMVIMKKQSS